MRPHGFTALELMAVISIIGILSAIAIPNYVIYQHRAQATEAMVGIEAIGYLQRLRILEVDETIACPPNPPEVPTEKVEWKQMPAWEALGYAPVGQVRFQYEVTVPADKSTFTAIARADLDGDVRP